MLSYTLKAGGDAQLHAGGDAQLHAGRDAQLHTEGRSRCSATH